jgi:hypothetical protein
MLIVSKPCLAVRAWFTQVLVNPVLPWHNMTITSRDPPPASLSGDDTLSVDSRDVRERFGTGALTIPSLLSQVLLQVK